MKLSKVPDWMLSLTGSALTAVVLCSMLAIAAGFYFGSVSNALAYARGERIVVSPGTVRFPPAPPDGARHGFCRVKNLGAEPVLLIGSSACCECALTRGLGLRIAPGATEDLEFTILNKSAGSRFSRVITIFTDNGHDPDFRVKLELDDGEPSQSTTAGL